MANQSFSVTGLTKSIDFLCSQASQLKFKAKRALETLSDGDLSFFLSCNSQLFFM